MLPVIALGLALLASQTTTPPPATDSPTTQPASSNSSATHQDKIRDGVTAPRVLYQVEPQFTKEARKVKLAGIATVALIVDTDGNPTDVHIVHSIADSLDEKHHDKKYTDAALSLDQAAAESVEKYKFAPATKAGKPVPVELRVQVNFQFY